jgi:hypothetical protein
MGGGAGTVSGHRKHPLICSAVLGEHKVAINWLLAHWLPVYPGVSRWFWSFIWWLEEGRIFALVLSSSVD